MKTHENEKYIENMHRQRVLCLILLISLLVSSLNAAISYKYSYIPKQVYATQVFSVTVFSDIDDSENQPEFTFDTQSPIQPTNIVPIKDTNGGKTFYTFFFKAKNSDLKVPELTITDKEQSIILEGKYIPVKTLDTTGHDEFCGLIATNCEISASQVSTFDDKNNLISLTIKATEANPKEIKTPGSIESGIEKLTHKGSKVVIEYYFVIPASKKSITISYYNTLQHKFISKTISTDFRNKPVAAQENLNPIDSSFDKLKKYGLIFLMIFFLIMFIIKKDFFWLPLLAVGAIALFTLFTPHEKICIQEGAILYILPTSTSTTGGQIEEKLETDVLNRRGNYYKIEYHGGIIGWIKDEDICND